MNMSAKIRAAVSVALMSSLFCGVAGAQILEEVVVTSQKHSENIQNVPIAFSAFTAESLQNKNIGDLHALSNLTPNVQSAARVVSVVQGEVRAVMLTAAAVDSTTLRPPRAWTRLMPP